MSADFLHVLFIAFDDVVVVVDSIEYDIEIAHMFLFRHSDDAIVVQFYIGFS